MKQVNYTSFDQAISKHRVRDRWRDSLFATTEKEKDDIAEKKYQKAKKDYTRMITSPKNDMSVTYHQWALNTALGIKSTKASHNRSLYSAASQRRFH